MIILSAEEPDNITREINERVTSTLNTEREALDRECGGMGFMERIAYEASHRLKNKLKLIVRKGDTFSTRQLEDISVSQAKTVIVLAEDGRSTVCGYEAVQRRESREKGDSATIKTLVQVAEMTAAEGSADDQVVVVEVEDEWTEYLANRIIEHKERLGKCNIVPIPVSRILGQLLSQFSIMPELNITYTELFSNKGAEFFCREFNTGEAEDSWVRERLRGNCRSIPLGTRDTKTGRHAFYVADSEEDYDKNDSPRETGYSVCLNRNYWMEQRNVIILGITAKAMS